MVVFRTRSIFWISFAIKIPACEPKLMRGLEDRFAVEDTWEWGSDDYRRRHAKGEQEVWQEAKEGQNLGRLDTNQEAKGSPKQEQKG